MDDPARNPPGVPPPPSAASLASSQSSELERRRWLLYNGSLAILVAAPLAALLPPRRLDLQTFGLGIGWALSLSYVLEARTGQGLLWHVGSSMPGARSRRRELEQQRAADTSMGFASSEQQQITRQHAQEEQRHKQRSFWKRIWLGDEPDNWIEKRAEEEREALESGRGYGALIMDSIRQAFGSGDASSDDDLDEQTTGDAKRASDDNTGRRGK